MFVPVKHIISRGLPKTGQTTSYITTDDGDTEIGWWKGLTDAQNRTRFVSVTISGGDVVIDRATGLMWAADGNEAGCNNGNTINWYDGSGSDLSDYPALSYAAGLSLAGFTDWRLPNINELLSIVDYSTSIPAIDTTLFPNTGTGADVKYWSSTTFCVVTSKALIVDFYYGLTELKTKYGSPPPNVDTYMRCVRSMRI